MSFFFIWPTKINNYFYYKTKDRLYIANTYARFPIEIVSGKGSTVVDENGKEYIDMGSGIAVNIFGMCDEEWVSAVAKQLTACQHTSNLYFTEPCAKLAKENSKASTSLNVSVDYCYARYVKKVSGAKPGMVHYTNFKTIIVK